MWPISARVNKPENDDPSIVESVELATDAHPSNDRTKLKVIYFHLMMELIRCACRNAA
jgi:hypothetical protein